MGDDRELSCLLSAWALGLVSALEVGGAAERAGMGEGLWDALVRLAGLSDRERFLAEEYASLHKEKGEEGAAALWSAAARDAELMRALEGLSGGVMETLLEWKGRIPEVRGEPGGSTLLRAFGGSSSTMKDAGIPAEAPVELRRGERDRYAFGEELGRGGLGRVLDAVDLDFGREVAVKMMLPGQSASAVERFLRESRAAGRLPHPNIIPVYEMGYLKDEAGAAPYFTMARIQGRNLREILTSLARGDEEAHASFNRPRLLRIFEEVCHAVSFAHDHGVLHRDLKPANVMVGDYGEVFVVDWGLAKFLDPPPASSGGAPGPCSEPLADGEQAEEGGESTGGPEGGGGGGVGAPMEAVAPLLARGEEASVLEGAGPAGGTRGGDCPFLRRGRGGLPGGSGLRPGP